MVNLVSGDSSHSRVFLVILVILVILMILANLMIMVNLMMLTILVILMIGDSDDLVILLMIW